MDPEEIKPIKPAPAEHYKGPGWEALARCGIYLPVDYVSQEGLIGGELGDPQ
jgi:hypothetical protein